MSTCYNNPTTRTIPKLKTKQKYFSLKKNSILGIPKNLKIPPLTVFFRYSTIHASLAFSHHRLIISNPDLIMSRCDIIETIFILKNKMSTINKIDFHHSNHTTILRQILQQHKMNQILFPNRRII